MNEQDTKFEEFDVSVPIGLTFENFDFVIGAFNRTGGDGILKVAEQSITVTKEHIYKLAQGVDNSLSEPSSKQLSGLTPSPAIPEGAQLLFENIGNRQGLVEIKEVIQFSLSLCIIKHLLLALKQKVASSLMDTISQEFKKTR